MNVYKDLTLNWIELVLQFLNKKNTSKENKGAYYFSMKVHKVDVNTAD